MPLSLLTTLICIAVALTALAPSAAHADASLDSQFNQANIFYQNEKYSQAVAAYQAILTQQQSPSLHYNLANAYFKIGEYGPAILHYRKALILDPRNPEFKANLQFAIEAAQVNHPPMSWLDNYAHLMKVNTWLWLAVINFWLAGALAVLPRYFQWRGILPWVLCGSALFFFGLSVVGLYGYRAQSNDSIVITNDAPIKVAPTTNVTAKAYLANGEFATIISEQNNYYLIDTLKGQSGFIQQEHLAKIWEDY